MARKKSKAGDFEEKLPQSLALAEKWAKQMGKQTQRGEAIFIDGNKVPILSISHANKPIWVRQENHIIVIFVRIEVPKEVSEQIKTLNKAEQNRIMLSLKHQLLSEGRTGYILEPSGVVNLEELSAITIEQRIRISSKDHSSFNRFGDAIQEIVTVAVKSMLVFGILPTGVTSSKSSEIKPPEGMYA